MSILIQGMDIPLRCINCPFETYYHGKNRCLANRGKTIEWEIGHDRGRDCPLLPLPEKHGRLIDADALMAKFERMETAFLEHGRPFSFSFKDGGEMCAEWWIVQDALSREPTIIEAEGGTENADPAD